MCTLEWPVFILRCLRVGASRYRIDIGRKKLGKPREQGRLGWGRTFENGFSGSWNCNCRGGGWGVWAISSHSLRCWRLPSINKPSQFSTISQDSADGTSSWVTYQNSSWVSIAVIKFCSPRLFLDLNFTLESSSSSILINLTFHKFIPLPSWCVVSRDHKQECKQL